MFVAAKVLKISANTKYFMISKVKSSVFLLIFGIKLLTLHQK